MPKTEDEYPKRCPYCGELGILRDRDRCSKCGRMGRNRAFLHDRENGVRKR